jgi:type II secretory pathway component PulK
VLAAGWVAILVVIAMMVASAASLVVRYRHARGPERQQVKWLAGAAAGVAVVYAVVVPIGRTSTPRRKTRLRGSRLPSPCRS